MAAYATRSSRLRNPKLGGKVAVTSRRRHGACMFELQRIDHVALSVKDVDRSVRWYCEILGFSRQFEGMWDDVPVFLGVKNITIALFPASSSRLRIKSGDTPRLLHFALRTDRENFKVAQSELGNRAIPFHFQDHEIAHSIYFDDPDGHEIEITTYDL